MRTFGVSAVAVNNEDWIPITDATDLWSNILVGKCDEYVTLICRRELGMFIHEGWGR